MIYVYIFEDGNMIQTNEHPSDEDYESIANGILEILLIKGTVVGIDHDSREYEIEKK